MKDERSQNTNMFHSKRKSRRDTQHTNYNANPPLTIPLEYMIPLMNPAGLTIALHDHMPLERRLMKRDIYRCGTHIKPQL